MFIIDVYTFYMTNHFCAALAFIVCNTIFCSSIRNARMILQREIQQIDPSTMFYTSPVGIVHTGALHTNVSLFCVVLKQTLT